MDVLSAARRAPEDVAEVPASWWGGAAFLLDTGVLALAHDAKRASLEVLLDLRGALQIREGLVAVLLVEGIRDLRWQEQERRGPLSPWIVVGGGVDRAPGGLLSIDLVCAPSARLQVQGDRARLAVIDVPGLTDVELDHSRDAAEVLAATPTWSSPGILLRTHPVDP